jgi:dCMP deaminase
VSMDELPREYQRTQVFLTVARTIAMLGTCDRSKVGAIIVRDGRCISWGYNGAPPGLPHCSENYHGWTGNLGIHLAAEQGISPQEWIDENGCINATHAEANALAYAARQGISTDGATLYVTLSPCETCSRLLIAAGIVEVKFDKQYRKDHGILLLKAAGVKVVG